MLEQVGMGDSARCTLERIGQDLVFNLVVHLEKTSNFDESQLATPPNRTLMSEYFRENDGTAVYMWQAVSPELVSP